MVGNYEHLQRVFYESFSAIDLAEPLFSFDAGTSRDSIQRLMIQEDVSIVGMRENGRVTGYLSIDDLGTTAEAEEPPSVREIPGELIITHSADLAETVGRLSEQPFLFVSLLGTIHGTLHREDLQKSPMRMWLFGMVTLIEERTTRLIRELTDEDFWQTKLSEARIDKARQLQSERQRRGQHVDLLDCFQFSDKGQIIARSETLRTRTALSSRRQTEMLFKRLEHLRNNLAHAQDIVSGDWETIVLLSEHLDTILQPRTLRDEPASDPA